MLVIRSSTNYNFQITPGNYSISSLLNSIQTGMNSVDNNNYVLSYSNITYQVNITSSTNFILNWSSNPYASSGCYSILGWTNLNNSQYY